MKILLVSSGKFFSTYGGGQVYVKNIVDELVRQGACPTIVTPGPMGDLPEYFDGCAVYTYDLDAGEAELQSLLLKIRPDIVHAHGFKKAFSAACAALGIPCIVTAHHGGIVCPAGALLNQRDEICTVPAELKTCLSCCIRSIPAGKLWLPLLQLIPFGVQIGFGRWLRKRQFMYLVTPIGTMLLSIQEKLAAIEMLGRCASLLIAPSPAIRDALVRNGVPESKVVIIPHGIPLPPRRLLRISDGKGPIRFLYVGRINHVKGIHIMLEAFTGLPPESYILNIVGGAVTKPERRYWAKLQRQYASVNAIWLGSRSHEEITQHIASCDVMVHPAICLEIFGLSIAEALAVGRVVIASRCGGAEAQICDSENGLLVPPNDVTSLRKAVQSMIDNPARIKFMCKINGDVESIERHVEKLEKVYIEVVNECKETKKGRIS